MARISEETRARNEQAIRAAMECLLSGDVPPDGSADLKTLARMAGVPRTGFYPKKNRDGTPRPGPYQHLAEQFDRCLNALHRAGTIPDPKAAQIERLKEANATLKQRMAQHEAELAELKEFRKLALSRIAAQHLEIERLREQTTSDPKVTALPRRAAPASSVRAADTTTPRACR